MTKKKETNIWKKMYEAREKAEEECDKDQAIREQKEERFKRAIALASSDAKVRWISTITISDSYSVALGESPGHYDFPNTTLVKIFSKILEDFRKDADKFSYDIATISMSAEMRFKKMDALS